MNPALYALASNFSHDVVSGNNKCCAGHNISAIVCCSQGFNSVVGWDPVTGFGSLDFSKFLTAMVAFNVSSIKFPSSSSASSSSSSGLSGGAIAGIVIAALVVVVCFNIAAIHLLSRKSTKDAPLIEGNRENSKFGS